MSKSGSFLLNKSSTSSYIEGKVEWSSTPNTSKNQSSVTAKLYVRKGPSTIKIATKGKWSYTLNINGNDSATHTLSESTSVLKEWVLIATKTVTVSHNSDGSKSISIEASVKGPKGTSYANHTTSKSQTVTLDTLYTATTPKLSSTSLDLDGTSTVTITLSPAKTAYTHTLTYTLGNSGTQSLTISSNKATLTGSVDLAAYIPKSDSATCTITCNTYNSSTQSSSTLIGTKTATLTVNVPKNYPFMPTTNASISGHNKYVVGMDMAAKSFCIQGISTCSVFGALTPGSGSSISSCVTTGPGFTSTNQPTISYDYGVPFIQGSTDVITQTGDLQYQLKMTDTRGRSDTHITSIYFYPYHAPIVRVSAARDTNSKTTINVTCSVDCVSIKEREGDTSDIERNTLQTLKVQCKPSTDVWGGASTRTITVSDGNFTASFTSCAEDKEYDVRAYAIDGVTKYFNDEKTSPDPETTIASYSQVVNVSTIYRLLNIDVENKTIAIGHMATHKNTFECDLNAEFAGDMNIGHSFLMDGDLVLYQDPYTHHTIMYGDNVVIGATEASDIKLGGNTTVTENLTIQNHSTPIGSVVQATYESVDASSGTYTHITSVTLPAGSWIITGSLYHPGIAGTPSGIYRATLSTIKTDSTYRVPNRADDTLGGTIDSALYGNKYAQDIEVVLLNKIDSEETFYLTGFQNSGSALSLRGTIRAMRIA